MNQQLNKNINHVKNISLYIKTKIIKIVYGICLHWTISWGKIIFWARRPRRTLQWVAAWSQTSFSADENINVISCQARQVVSPPKIAYLELSNLLWLLLLLLLIIVDFIKILHVARLSIIVHWYHFWSRSHLSLKR